MNHRIKSLLIALGGGILMGLSPAPTNAWYLAWFALVPLWFLVRSEKFLSWVILTGLVWGCGYHGLGLFWITGVHPMTWMGVPWLASLLIAIFCWLFITFWGAVLVATWSILFKLVINRLDRHTNKTYINSAIVVLVGVALWCGLETLWSYGSLWWTSLSYTQSPNNLAILQLGKISGFSTITAVIVAVNGLLTEVVLSWRSYKRQTWLWLSPLSIFIVSHAWGYYLYQYPIAVENLEPIEVGIVQGNVPNEIKLSPTGWRKAIQGYTTGYEKLARQGVDVVLTPETALPFYWHNIIDNSEFYRTVTKNRVPVWVGAFGESDRGYTNSLFTLTAQGKTFSRYDKYKLVPLGEYIPFEPILGKLVDRLSPLEAHLIPGKPNPVFDTPFGKAIVGICYESAYSEHFRRQAKAGGEFIITSSNNAHYSTTMPAQHHAQDVMRAIESDRWAARATNTGYSAIVDPRGNTLWISPLEQYAIHAGTIYRRQHQTLYVRWGNWLTPTLILLGVVSISIRK
ncbi:apolipoprotein N-acyltransferase [Myxosarcina sp. GI1]|uniref:apolipoprotein N-acyltransferase n=1 Tax=Myxosarcina sp. GI1 TaxID=1541065 RepID=UPI00055C3827|nr:apolipoprotein N-acyltransferase [Myxosarcina sp. GI1]